MTEGSVFVDGVDGESSESSESQETQSETTESTESGEVTQTEDSQEEADRTLSRNQEKAELTEKGTKADPNPLSRVNQELANERRKIKQYEDVLNNPVLLRRYVSQFEKPVEKQEKQEEEITLDQVQDTEGLQKYLKQQDRKVEEKLKRLDSAFSEMTGAQKDVAVADRVQSDIVTVREKYPELNPKSESYIQALDITLGKLFEKYDYDPKAEKFLGRVSLAEVADILMGGAVESRKRGSLDAQTTIKDKRTGKQVSGSTSAAPDETNMTPNQIIAARIKAARRG